jgi:hypothetical protein
MSQYYQMVYDEKVAVVPIGGFMTMVILSEDDLAKSDFEWRPGTVLVTRESLDPERAGEQLKEFADSAKQMMKDLRHEWAEARAKKQVTREKSGYFCVR